MNLHKSGNVFRSVRGLICACIAMHMAPQTSLADANAGIDRVDGCRAIAADAERLLCYDTVVDGDEYRKEQLQQAQVDAFGETGTDADVEIDEVDKIAVTIVKVTKSNTGTYYFHTANDQVWKQSGRGTWSRKVPFDAEIKAGTMGSYFLTNEGGKSTRVQRVR